MVKNCGYITCERECVLVDQVAKNYPYNVCIQYVVPLCYIVDISQSTFEGVAMSSQHLLLMVTSRGRTCLAASHWPPASHLFGSCKMTSSIRLSFRQSGSSEPDMATSVMHRSMTVSSTDFRRESKKERRSNVVASQQSPLEDPLRDLKTSLAGAAPSERGMTQVFI